MRRFMCAWLPASLPLEQIKGDHDDFHNHRYAYRGNGIFKMYVVFALALSGLPFGLPCRELRDCLHSPAQDNWKGGCRQAHSEVRHHDIIGH